MAFLNSNNFCRWGDLVNTNPSLSGSGSITDWKLDDIAPIGDNESAWTSVSNNAVVINGATESTKGLSQNVKIKAGHRYFINWEIKENLYGDTDFYIYFIGGSRSQQAVVKRIGATGNEKHQHEVVANSDYSKVLICAVAVAGAGISVYVNDFRLMDAGRCDYAIPLLKGDTISIFGNVEFDTADVPFTNLKIGLWKHDQGIYLLDIASLNQNVISGTIYSFYVTEWIVPELPSGSFSFILYNDDDFTDTMVYYWSNAFKKLTRVDYTSLLKYRNAADALGYQYASVPAFYNKFRIDLRVGYPQNPENAKGYETYDGDFIKVKSDITKIREFETRFLDEGAHEAFASMLSHSEILIDNIEYKKNQDSTYEVSYSEFDDTQIGNGIVTLLDADYSSAVKLC